MISLQAKRACRWYEDEMPGNTCKKVIKIIYYMSCHVEQTLQARSMWCLISCLVFSYLGLLYEIYFFAFTMIYLLIFSSHILEVTRAIWQPRGRIISTIILSFVVFYWFAIIAYAAFDNDFAAAVTNSNQSLIRSLVVIFDSWHKNGLGGFLDDEGKSAIRDDNGNYDPDEARIAYDFIFFFIVPTLLLSILSGIIVDNFVERRSHNDSIRQRQNDL